MREIKFRVWDNEQQEYLNTDILHIKNDGTLLISKKGENPWSALLASGCNSERFVIEFSTGLKDKNGTEIYEGDVVQYYPRHNGVPYRVYWANESAKFLIGRKGVVGQELSSVMYNLDTGRIVLEVIGNIHENPKLGEEEK